MHYTLCWLLYCIRGKYYHILLHILYAGKFSFNCYMGLIHLLKSQFQRQTSSQALSHTVPGENCRADFWGRKGLSYLDYKNALWDRRVAVNVSFENWTCNFSHGQLQQNGIKFPILLQCPLFCLLHYFNLILTRVKSRKLPHHV